MQPGRNPPTHAPSPFAFAPSSSNPAHPATAATAPPGGFSSFGERGRGRGRGGARGTGRGAGGAGAPGLAQHRNLSWCKPADDAPLEQQDNGEKDEGPAEQPAASAFAAFGAGPHAGSAFGSGGPSAFTAFGGAGTSAFGAPAPSAFGAGAGAFGGSAFGASTSTAPPPTSAPSPFASTSTFSPAAPASSTPLFRAPSRQSEGEATPEPAAKRTNGQISTLEVLGEDSDARKKRFEASLPNNRYLELKPLREAQRLRAIKEGLIPDPSKPMRLDEATDFEGTCEEMCPEWEREEREYQNNVDPLERYPGTTRIDPARAVKAFHRPAAGNDQPLPSDVRPPPVLHSTLDYLFHTLLPTLPLATTHPFIRDRTRSIRQDFTVQNVRGRSAIECNERIARYHILAVGALREQSGFSESQELEQLRKVLKSLNEFYDDARMSGTAVPSPNEAEFRAYNLLTHLRDPDIIWSTELLPPSLFAHPLLQRALALHRLAQRANIPRGERAAPGAFARFFKLVADKGTPYLFACILSTHFADVRRGALDALRGAFLRQHSAFPLATLAKMLGCDDEAETRSVCEQFGLVVRADESGAAVAEIHKQAVLKAVTLKPRVSMRLVEGKRGSMSYQDVIDGRASGPAAAASLPSATPTPALRGAVSSAPAGRTAAPAAAPAVAFSFAPRPAAVTPIPSPFESPAFGATPAPTPAAGGLNAAAAAFVPSFSLAAPAVPPSAPVSAAPPPPTTFPSFPAASKPLAPTAPAFSFAPTPTPPPLAPPPPAAAAPAPLPDVPRPTKRLPPSSLRTAISAAPFVPAPAPAPPSLSTARVSLSPTLSASTARRVSLAHPHPQQHAAEAPFPSASSAAASAARTAVLDALAAALAGELLGAQARACAQRVAAGALRERWAAVRAGEQAEREALAARVARAAGDELARLAVREALLCGVRDEERVRGAWGRWRGALRRRREWKKGEREKKRVWEEVVRGIEREKEVEAGDEDEVLSDGDEDDDAGLAGLADAGLDFGGLSLGGPASAPRDDLAARVRDAAATRDRIWQRGTFLNILSASASTAFARAPVRLPARPTWTALVATEKADEPFAAWLACKLDLDAREGTAEVDVPNADVEVRMLSREDEPVASELRSTGLVIFDCTATKTPPLDWPALRGRLHSLLARITSRSLFRPAVLAVICPSRTLSPAEAASLRDQAAQELQLQALAGGGGSAGAGIWVAKLEGAEEEFEAELARLLDAVSVREERIPRPLSAPALALTYLAELQATVDEAESVASPAPRSRFKLPPFEVSDASFRTAVETYASLPHFRSAGHFPDLLVALAARPPLSDLALARLTLEHLALFASSSLAPLRIPAGALAADLPSALERRADALAKAEARLLPRSRAPSPPSTPTPTAAPGKGKKRRASAAPAGGVVSSPKKLNGAPSGGEHERDRLSALEGLMKDARALLAR
ncbi:actin cytoskeleton and mitosis protein [Rhodotorula kratochvilovae]